MRRMITVTLISFRPDAHEVGEDPVDRQRDVRAQEMSLNLYDRTEAGGQGLSPEAKLLIPYDRDYEGERELIYNGERWTVTDADPYKDWNGVILRIRRKKGNSGSLQAAEGPEDTHGSPEAAEGPEDTGGSPEAAEGPEDTGGSGTAQEVG